MAEQNNIQKAYQQAEDEQMLNIPAKRILEKTKDIPSDVNKLKRRWFWELLQNASDYNEEVEVILELFADKIVFKHNGLPFSPMDARNLIAPDSGKDNSESRAEDTIGQFGTGFISTHVLSSIITVEGIVKVDTQYAPFTFDLDRTGYNDKELLKVSISKASEQLKQDKGLVDYQPRNFNTLFKYDITKPLAGIVIDEVIVSGLEYVHEVLPFTLAFMPKIKKVTILNHNTNYLDFCKREYIQKVSDTFSVAISTYKNNLTNYTVETKEFQIAENQNATVILNVQEKNIAPYPEQLTKLFCSLPMIGTENFSFPIVINSTKFNPKTERDGIRLSNVESLNREILTNALEAFKVLISKLVQDNYSSFYNIIKWQRHITDDYNERNWYINITNSLKNYLLTQPIVITTNGSKIDFDSVKIPYFPKEDKIDDYLKDFYELAALFHPNYVPQESDFIHWYNNIDFTVFGGTRYELKELLLEVKNLKSVDNLNTVVEDPIKWLNSLIALVLKVDENLLDQFAIIPNQLGDFLLRKDSLFWDNDVDDELIQIYNILNTDDYRKLLLHKEFEINSTVLPYDRKKSTVDIAKSIDDAFSEYPEAKRTDDEFQRALRLMFKWFVDSGESDKELKELFKWFYYKKPTLFLETFDDISRDKVFAISQSGKLDSLSKLAESKITEEELQVVTSNIEDVVKLATVLNDIEGGMDLLIKYAQLIKEDQEDFKFKKAIGENIEAVFKETLLNSGINAEIKHDGWSANDFEIKNINNGKSYFIELKSIASNHMGNLKLSVAQAKKAILNPTNYSLSVLQRPDNINIVNEYYIKHNIKSKNNISNLLIEGINDFEKINSIKSSNRLHLTFRDEIRINVGKQNICENSDTFEELVEKIKKQLQ
jgi:hypothetical protein